MPAYAYPIQIRPHHLSVGFEEIRTIDDRNFLTLEDFAFILPGDVFFVGAGGEDGWGCGYVITVRRTRLETDAERDTRVARETAYMQEYTRRQALQPSK